MRVQIPPQLSRGAALWNARGAAATSNTAPEALSAMHWLRKPGTPVRARTGALPPSKHCGDAPVLYTGESGSSPDEGLRRLFRSRVAQ